MPLAHRRILALTLFISLFLLLFLPYTFALPFHNMFGFPLYLTRTDRQSVLMELCSLEEVNGYGLPVFVGNLMYFLALPSILYLTLVGGLWLWKSDKTQQ